MTIRAKIPSISPSFLVMLIVYGLADSVEVNVMCHLFFTAILSFINYFTKRKILGLMSSYFTGDNILHYV